MTTRDSTTTTQPQYKSKTPPRAAMNDPPQPSSSSSSENEKQPDTSSSDDNHREDDDVAMSNMVLSSLERNEFNQDLITKLLFPNSRLVPPPRKPYNPKWPSYLMQLISDNTADDEWMHAMERILTHPHEIVVKGRLGGMTALHAACNRYPPLHIIEAMVLFHPDLVLEQNSSGETPLHLAAYSSSDEVQALLLRTQPLAAMVVDQYGDCPLHFAARQGAAHPLLELYILAAPATISLPNNRFVTPFWLLPRSYLEVEQAEELFDDDVEDYKTDLDLLILFLKYSYYTPVEALSIPIVTTAEEFLTNYGWLIYAAVSTPSCPREAVRFLCRMFPNVALQYNEEGYTPLLLASRVGLVMEEPTQWDETEDGFRELVDIITSSVQNSDQVMLPDEAGTLSTGNTDFLLLVAAQQQYQQQQQLDQQQQVDQNANSSSSNTSQSVIDILLEWSPASITYADRDGRLPLCHALISGKSWDTVRKLILACPRAIECRDKPTNMFMIHLAAIHSPDLDTIYALVRSLPLLLSVHSSGSGGDGYNRATTTTRYVE